MALEIYPSVLRNFSQGLDIAMKIEDGNSDRALGPAVIEALLQLGLLDRGSLKELKSYHQSSILNHRKQIVGKIRARFTLF